MFEFHGKNDGGEYTEGRKKGKKKDMKEEKKKERKKNGRIRKTRKERK